MPMIDVTDQDFEAQVIERSRTTPVVIDLWAEWCGPCKTLGPILDRVIDETGGSVVGVKVDIESNPAIAQAFQVQSIPMVVAFKDGQAVDGFLGAQDEGSVREFVSKLMPSADDLALQELLDAGDESSLRQVLDSQPGHPNAIAALAQILIEAGRHQEALELLARIPETAETRHLAALARTGAEAASAAADEHEARLAELLPTVKGDDDARQEFVDLLEVMGPENPATADWRRRLTSALF